MSVGAGPPSSAGPAPSVPELVLTFDDGPDPVWTPRVLDTLAEIGWRATFFVHVARACCHMDVVARALAEGHEIGLHCVGHVSHERMTAEEGEFEARCGVELLEECFGAGVVSRWRPPYGACAPWQPEVASSLGLQLTLWSVDARDWTGAPAPAMLAAVAPQLRSGSIVLLHDGIGPGARRSDAAETIRLVRLLAKSGMGNRPLDRAAPR